MKFTVIIPHYQVGQMTAYCLHQLFTYGGSQLKIIVVNNSPANHESLRFIAPFLKHITLLQYPEHRTQSHGAAFDYALPYVDTDYFMTVETDSFPTDFKWITWCDFIAKGGYHASGSFLHLSGGFYLHPAGAIYHTQTCLRALADVAQWPYVYFPNAARADGFDYHLMVHERLAATFCQDPTAYITQLAPAYEPAALWAAAQRYRPLTGLFHCGMGNQHDSIKNYTERSFETERNVVAAKSGNDVIYRVGYEPGQYYAYWLSRPEFKIMPVDTTTRWLPNREGQQQEFTLTEHGFKHLWGITAYHKCTAPELQDIVEFKARQLDELYASLPAECRI